MGYTFYVGPELEYYAPCPHCHRRICRQCWSAAWASKSFSAEACGHLMENDGLAASAMPARNPWLQLDWGKGIFIAILAALAIGICIFLFNLFVF